jgi:hypothetical protein
MIGRMKRTVSLNGDPRNLKTLADLDLGVTQEGHGYVLRSPEFDALTDAGAVRQRTAEIVESLNGLARIEAGEYDAVHVGAVAGEDGSKTRQLFVGEAISLCAREEAEIVDTATGQPVAPPPRADYKGWMTVAGRDPSVRKALRLYGGSPTPSPAALYNIFEIIEQDVGGRLTAWVSGNQISRFTHSVNSADALGDAARHGGQRSQPPPDPMGVEEADAFIRSLLKKWLEEKWAQLRRNAPDGLR